MVQTAGDIAFMNHITGSPAPKTGLSGQIMEGLPLPSISGGDAAPSAANAQTGTNFIYANSGNTGAWLFISIAAIVGFVIWKKKK